jgi:hypothetical protein
VLIPAAPTAEFVVSRQYKGERGLEARSDLADIFFSIFPFAFFDKLSDESSARINREKETDDEYRRSH